MTNIFKNAYFGKPYKTRDGQRVIYFEQHRGEYSHLLLFSPTVASYYDNNGKNEDKSEFDIISEWSEEVNEGELDKLAEESEKEQIHIAKQCEALGQCYGFDYKVGFKAGYLKALE